MSSEIFDVSKRLFLHDSLQCQDYQKIRENEVLLGRQFARSFFDGKRTSFKPKSFIIGMSVSKLTIKCEETAGSGVAKGTIYVLIFCWPPDFWTFRRFWTYGHNSQNAARSKNSSDSTVKNFYLKSEKIYHWVCILKDRYLFQILCLKR